MLWCHLKEGVVERCATAWEMWGGRLPGVGEGILCVGEEGVKFWDGGEIEVASIIGSVTLGLRGSDVDCGIPVDSFDDQPREGAKYMSVEYFIDGEWVLVHSEYDSIGLVECVALPRKRVDIDMFEYRRAAEILDCFGRENWLEMKKKDKLEAYRFLHVSLAENGRFYW